MKIRSTLLTLALALSACGEDEAPPPVTPVAAKKKVEAEAPVEAPAQVDYVYVALNKRDPFRSPVDVVVDRGTTATDVVPDSCNDPLCQTDLDELKVVAVVTGDANPLAMVEDRSGVGYLVRRNTRVGKQGGKVIQILRDCVVVLSFVSGGADGKPQPNKQNLCVQADGANTPALDLLKNKEFVP